ncbi:MAG TPA: ATP-binding cassette domain-containing protein [Gemmatimonadota bacterium]|jgi:ABC-2 type transport system ATP-binding protein
MSLPAPVEVDDLGYSYGDREALKGVSFTVGAGELFGLLGPNGGGKTTLLQILTTLRRPTRGRARVAGADVVERPAEARRGMGVVFQHAALDPQLSPMENLRHQGHLYGLRGPALAERARELLDRLGVLDRADDRVKTLSGGLRRRVELAKGLLHGPRVLLLDEPTLGLDPGGRRDLWKHARALRETEGVAILVTTHLMDEAEACDRIGILDRGALVALDTPASLKDGIRGDVISLASDDPRRLADAIRERFDSEASVVDGAVRIERRDGAELVPRLAEAFPGVIRSITVGAPTLEDVFVQRTGHRFWESTAQYGEET